MAGIQWDMSLHGEPCPAPTRQLASLCGSKLAIISSQPCSTRINGAEAIVKTLGILMGGWHLGKDFVHAYSVATAVQQTSPGASHCLSHLMAYIINGVAHDSKCKYAAAFVLGCRMAASTF